MANDGIGARQLHVLPVATDGRPESATLEAALSQGSGPAIVALNSADLNLGAFDPFTTLGGDRGARDRRPRP